MAVRYIRSEGPQRAVFKWCGESMKKALLLAAAVSLASAGAASAVTLGSYSSKSGMMKSFAYAHAYGKKVKQKKLKMSKRESCDSFFRAADCSTPGDVTVGNGNGNVDSPSEVPVPAAGFLLLAGLGAFALTKRRK